MQEKKDKIQTGKRKTILKPGNKVDAFFGRLPKIEDSLAFQKKVRSEWR